MALRVRSSESTESFFAGPENALVCSLRTTVESAFVEYNPVVLYGPPGAGKSSIAQSLVAQRRQKLDLAEVISTTADDLARGLAHAVDTASVADFRARHHRCDLLFIDDVHHLKGRPAAQQFLLTTLDALVRRGSLMVCTMRQSPQATPGLSPQLASRLSAGLVVRVSLPGPLARQKLVEQFAHQVGCQLDALEMNRIACCDAESNGPYLTAASLKRAVLKRAARREFGSNTEIPTPPDSPDQPADNAAICRQITSVVAKHFRLTMAELKSKSRRQAIADARSLAMFLTRRLTGASYTEIGRHFGNRDHTTVLHACRRISKSTDRDEYLRNLADELASQVAAATVP